MKKRRLALIGSILFFLGSFMAIIGWWIKVHQGTIAPALLTIGILVGIAGIVLFMMSILIKPKHFQDSGWEERKK